MNKTLTPPQRLALALGLLLVVVGIGTLGFVLLEGRGFTDSLYMTLVTISTLGMKSADSAAISQVGKIWIIFLIVVGIALAMISVSIVTAMVVEGQIRGILGRRKVDTKIASLSGHIIVCGYGRMGRSASQSLRDRGVSPIVIDHSDDRTAQAEKDGFLYILGEASDEPVLHDAGIERAKGVVTVLDTDAANVFVTLVARDLNPDVRIVSRIERSESESRLIRAGADKAICPREIGATRLANILTRPGVVDFIDFAAQGLDLEAEQYHITSGSKLIGQSLRQANLPRQIGVLVIALKQPDGKTVFNPHPDTVLQLDDIMLVTGQVGSIAGLDRQYS